MIRFAYLPVHFFLCFDTAVYADNSPVFVLRSVLGKQLRSMCCIARTNKCPACLYNKTCAYATIFETILGQDNAVQPGRDRASHPFAFTQNAAVGGEKFLKYDFTMTLFGNAVNYLPYIYAAFVRAGKEGLFKSRIPFAVSDVQVAGQSVLADEGHIKTDVAPLSWEFQDDGERKTASKRGSVLVELLSPLRFKVQGTYTVDFDAPSFMSCLFRRMKTLSLLYGSCPADIAYTGCGERIAVSDRDVAWRDATHYSARQKRAMALGGVQGKIRLEGEFSPFERALLEFNHICNAGKNTNFGLGQMDYWTKWERS